MTDTERPTGASGGPAPGVNFIHAIIDRDMAEGKYGGRPVLTR
jgi:hypothetical protein